MLTMDSSICVAVTTCLAAAVTAVDHVLLNGGDLFKRGPYAKVAAGDHHAVARFDDLLQILNAAHIFNFGYNLYIPAAVFIEQGAQIVHVLRTAHKRGRDKIHILTDAEEQIAAVRLADIGHVNIGIGQVDALAVGEPPAVERLADNVAAAHTGDGKRDLAVVHENAGAGRDILRKAREGHLHSRLVAIAGRGAGR